MRNPILTAAVLATLPALPAFAAFQQTRPAAAPTTAVATTAAAAIPEGSISATVEEVRGNVFARTAPDAPWKRAEVGMVLPEGAELKTGLSSSVRCSMPPEQTFVVDRLTTVRIAEAVRQGGRIRTDLNMKYGRTQYQVQAAGLEHESTISSPGSTLAVRGTTVALTNAAPFPPTAVSFTGRASFRAGKRTTAFGGTGAGTIAVNASNRDAADAALVAAVVDPRVESARTPSEKIVIAQQTARGAVLGFDQIANIPTLRGGSPIRTEAELLPTLPGVFNIVARWQTNADINLSVFITKTPTPELVGTPAIPPTADEFVYPGFGLNRSASGGITAFDHKGGPKGGTEIVYWPSNTFPQGVYGIQLTLVSGAPTNVTLNVFQNGQKKNFIGNFILQLDENGLPVLDENGFPTVVGVEYPTTVNVPLPQQFPDPFNENKIVTVKTSSNLFLIPDQQFIENLAAAGTPVTDPTNGAPADLPDPTPAVRKAAPKARAVPAAKLPKVIRPASVSPHKAKPANRKK